MDPSLLQILALSQKMFSHRSALTKVMIFLIVGASSSLALSFSSGRWRLSMNVGRESGTWMPSDWGASGTRLAVPLVVDFKAEPYTGEVDRLIGRKAMKVVPVESEAIYMTEGGERKVKVGGGGWTIEPPAAGGPAVIRFWLEFGAGAAKRDVEIPTGQVFFSAAGWMDEEVATGEKARKELLGLLEGTIGEEFKQASDDYGRAGLFEKILKLPRLVKATIARDNAAAKMFEVRSGQQAKRVVVM